MVAAYKLEAHIGPLKSFPYHMCMLVLHIMGLHSFILAMVCLQYKCTKGYLQQLLWVLHDNYIRMSTDARFDVQSEGKLTK